MEHWVCGVFLDSGAFNEEEEAVKFDDEIMSGFVHDISRFVQDKEEEMIVEMLSEDVQVQQVAVAFGHKFRMFVVVSALFPNGSLNADGVKTKSKFINEFVTSARMPLAAWTWGFESYLVQNPTALKSWAMMLKALYDEDLADEEEISEYNSKDRSNPVLKASKTALVPLLP